MGQAIVGAAIEAGILTTSDVVVVEPDEARRETMIKQWGVRASPELGSPLQTLHESEQGGRTGAVLLAVKPQSLSAVAAGFPAAQRSAERLVI